jgi:hypothetical protein
MNGNGDLAFGSTGLEPCYKMDPTPDTESAGHGPDLKQARPSVNVL